MWSSWEGIEQTKFKERGCFGIYQIRVVDRVGNPLPVGRIVGVDQEGVIYIGKAGPVQTLAKRIHKFENVSKLGKAKHSGGETYILLKMKLIFSDHAFKNHKLQYKVVHLDTDRIGPELNGKENFKHKIETEEINALADYFNKYGELPPCNSTFPGKWNRFTDRLQELWRTSGQQQAPTNLPN